MREHVIDRMLRRLLPAALRRDVFDPALGDLRIEYLKARARRRVLAGAAHGVSVVLLWLDCWRLAATNTLTACTTALAELDWSDAMQDIRYGLRLIARQPAFAAVVVATLSLGIGASTTLFSVVHAVLLKPLPYGDPSALVWMFGAFRGADSAAVSPPDFVDYRERNEGFRRMGAMAIAPNGVTVSTADRPTRLQASRVSGDLIATLGVAPALGRDFTRDDEADAARSVIISHRLWSERFGASPAALGQSLVVDDSPRTIVGVMPAGFSLPYDAFIRLADPVDLYLPLDFRDPDAQVRRFHWLRVIGRLKPGVSLRQAQAEMDVIARRLEATYPENRTWRLRLVPLHERIVGDVRPVLLVLMAAVVLLLLVACGNVAGLLLARATTRRNEMALRGALGASRGRVVRQLLVEGLLMSLAGGAAGLGLTWWAIAALKRMGPSDIPRLQTIALDPFVVAFALTTAVSTTLVFALTPALRISRGNLTASLRPASVTNHDRSTGRAQRVLVIGQLGASFVLLICAGLLTRSFLRLTSVDTGFRAAGVAITRVALPPERYDRDEKIDRYYGELLRRLEGHPGIDGVAFASAPPLSGANDTAVYRPEQPPQAAEDRRFAQVRWIRGDYFGTLGIPILSGRAFDDRADRPGAPFTAVINRRLARDFFGREQVIGEHLAVDLGSTVVAEIVGVTGDVRMFGQAIEAPATVYLSAHQHASFMQLIIRTAPGAQDVASIVRETVAAVDPMLAPSRVEMMEALLADSVAQPRFTMVLIGAFATVAAILAVVGLYGTLAYFVSRRRHEIGVRLALGATAGDIVRMVMRQGTALIVAGIVLGLAGALFATKFAARLLFEVRPADPFVFGAVAALVTLTSLAAIALPARRAARVEPLAALRTQ